MLAIIGGSGLTQLSTLEVTHREIVRTAFGEPSAPLLFGKLRDRDVVFLARHGSGHTITPHEVNYRANVFALHSIGVTRVVSVASVGSIRADLGPGMIVVRDQILDYTWGRKHTFFEGSDSAVTHIDFTHPYCDRLRRQCIEAAARAGERCVEGGVYAATQGPRLETAAEINRLERDGADMVGMTGMPEAALARELGLCYATIAVVVNHAAGRASSAEGIHLERVYQVLQETMVRVRKILEEVVHVDAS
ncbi:MAG TPA: S-methyl-5'-thioinosine phosphorylase [Burkholderiales bacterium]|nr:S-methyl-5'-thioinosine phosphorylase [Burkholderiales bacterium]